MEVAGPTPTIDPQAGRSDSCALAPLALQYPCSDYGCGRSNRQEAPGYADMSLMNTDSGSHRVKQEWTQAHQDDPTANCQPTQAVPK